MIRQQAIKFIASNVNNSPIISANGFISRDLFETFDKNTNFYMIGSMGLASSIGLGVALKNLRKRVPSYFAKQTSWKIKRLISEANGISFVVAKNEADALLAEYSFIQEYKPKYNVQFKDDKSYPYVTLTNEEWPRAYISRKTNSKNRSL